MSPQRTDEKIQILTLKKEHPSTHGYIIQSDIIQVEFIAKIKVAQERPVASTALPPLHTRLHAALMSVQKVCPLKDGAAGAWRRQPTARVRPPPAVVILKMCPLGGRARVRASRSAGLGETGDLQRSRPRNWKTILAFPGAPEKRPRW